MHITTFMTRSIDRLKAGDMPRTEAMAISAMLVHDEQLGYPSHVAWKARWDRLTQEYIG